MIPCKSTAEKVSFKWSHHRILYTDAKVSTSLHVSIIDSGSERVKIIDTFSYSTGVAASALVAKRDL